MSVLATKKGFASPGAIARLRTSRWAAIDGENENFPVLDLGGYCLTRPPDDLCSAKYRVVVTQGDERFEVEGFGFPSIPRAVTQGAPVFRPCRLFREELLPEDESTEKCGLVEYAIEVMPAES